MSNISENIKKISLNYGIISGCIGIIYILLLYLFDPTKLAGWFWSMIPFIICIIMMVSGSKNFKKMNQSYISFREALIISFLIFAVSLFISSIFNYILYNWIDADLSNLLKQQVLQNTIEWMENFGTPADTIEKAIKQIEEQDFNYTFKNLLNGYLIYLIIGLIISLIIAAFVKKNRPPFSEFVIEETK